MTGKEPYTCNDHCIFCQSRFIRDHWNWVLNVDRTRVWILRDSSTIEPTSDDHQSHRRKRRSSLVPYVPSPSVGRLARPHAMNGCDAKLGFDENRSEKYCYRFKRPGRGNILNTELFHRYQAVFPINQKSASRCYAKSEKDRHNIRFSTTPNEAYPPHTHAPAYYTRSGQ